jgi:hypothetical protein
MRLAIAIGVVAVTLSAAVYVHQRQITNPKLAACLKGNVSCTVPFARSSVVGRPGSRSTRHRRTRGSSRHRYGPAVATVAKERHEATVGPVFGPSSQEAEEVWADLNLHVHEPEVGIEIIRNPMEGSYSMRFFSL